MSVRFADLQYDDLSLLDALQPADWSSIRPPHEFYLTSGFCFPLKFMDEGRIVGIGTSILHEDSAWLAHIIVHPGQRGKGIGQHITRTLMEQVAARSRSLLYLTATDVGEPVYRKSGFETETEYLFFKDIQPFTSQSPEGMLTTYQPAFKEQILGLDNLVTGEHRATYLQAFLDDGIVYLNGGVLEGFYLPGAGEGLILAMNPNAGLALANLRFNTNQFSVFPADNIALKNYLEAAGHVPFKRQTKMRFGPKRRLQPAYMYNRIGGNLG